MPRLSEFYGVIIAMYYNDHAPPRFHAKYSEFEAVIAIPTLDVLRGSLPRRAYALTVEWAIAHRSELMANWERARRGEPLTPIAPLE